MYAQACGPAQLAIRSIVDFKENGQSLRCTRHRTVRWGFGASALGTYCHPAAISPGRPHV
jgi:hypothetical protein